MKTWEATLLKAQSLRTLSNFVGKAGLHSLMNWATETPDLVATVPSHSYLRERGGKNSIETDRDSECSALQ